MFPPGTDFIIAYMDSLPVFDGSEREQYKIFVFKGLHQQILTNTFQMFSCPSILFNFSVLNTLHTHTDLQDIKDLKTNLEEMALLVFREDLRPETRSTSS